MKTNQNGDFWYTHVHMRDGKKSIPLSPVHTSNNVEATFDFVAKTATMSNEFCVEISSF